MKHLIQLLLVILVISITSCDGRNSSTDEYFGLTSKYYKGVSCSKTAPSPYEVFPLESFNQYLSSEKSSDGNFFICFGSYRNEDKETQVVDLLVKFPIGSIMIKLPYNAINIHYCSSNFRIKINYNTLYNIYTSAYLQRSVPEYGGPVSIWIPEKLVMSDSIKSEYLYPKLKKS